MGALAAAKRKAHVVADLVAIAPTNLAAKPMAVASADAGALASSVVAADAGALAPALARADGGSTASSRQPRPFGNLEAVDWTNDHTPERPDEEKRLIAAGARVAPTGSAGGAAETEVHHGAVKRVWLPEKDTPGLAMSRSFGDAIGATVGVIAEPTVTKWQLTPDHRFAILATDGVWEFISSQEAVDLVGRALDAPRRTGHDPPICSRRRRAGGGRRTRAAPTTLRS